MSSCAASAGRVSLRISTHSEILLSPRCPKMSNLCRPTSSAVYMSKSTVGKPLGGKKVVEKACSGSCEIKIPPECMLIRLGSPCSRCAYCRSRWALSSPPGIFPSARASISNLGRPKTFPSSRTTARYWKVLQAPSRAVFGKRLKM